jgi:hypothetical protein
LRKRREQERKRERGVGGEREREREREEDLDDQYREGIEEVGGGREMGGGDNHYDRIAIVQ